MKLRMLAICLCILLALPGCANMAAEAEPEAAKPEEVAEKVDPVDMEEPEKPAAPKEPEKPAEIEEPAEEEETEAPEEPAESDDTAVDEDPAETSGFPYTPQEIVDILNESALRDDSGKSLLLDDYAESGAPIFPENGSTSIMLSLTENSAGMLEESYLFWMNDGNLNTMPTVGTICGTMLALFIPDHAQDVAVDLDGILNSGEGNVEYMFDNVRVYFEMLPEYGGFYITVTE